MTSAATLIEREPAHPRRRVLVVDDDEDFGADLRARLFTQGYEAQRVRVATDIGAVLSEFAADVALVDIHLDSRSGTSFIRKLKRARADTLCVMMTAHVTKDSVINAFKNRVYDYLQKPIVFTDLLATLERCFESIDLEREKLFAERAMLASEGRYQILVDSAPFCIHEVDLHGRIISMNPAGLKMIGAGGSEDVCGRAYVDFVAEPERKRITALLGRAFAGYFTEFEFSATLDGETKFFASSFVPLRNDAGDVFKLMGHTRDITERKQAEESLRASEERFRDFAETAADWLWETDADQRFIYVAGRHEEAIGFAADQIIGRKRTDFRMSGTEDDKVWRQHLDDVEARRPFRDFQYTLTSPDDVQRVVQVSGKPVFDRHGGFVGYRGSARDVTKAHFLSAQLSYQASHDALTSLLNRREFENRLERVLESAGEDESEHALCYLDLDQFKIINDTCSHVAGDELLRQLGTLLTDRVRKRDTLARLGGDEFGVLMEHCSLAQAQRVAHSLREAIASFRFSWGGQRFNIAVSIGLVPICGNSGNLKTVLSMADSACYAAKDEGRNRIHVYRENDPALVNRYSQMQWVPRLNRALQEGRFHLYLQKFLPLQEPDSSTEYGELLLRVEDEDGTIIEPEVFLPAAERFGLVVEIDHWVLGTTLDWLSLQSTDTELESLYSINISGHSLCDPAFLAFALQRVDESRVAPERLCFEITETAAITNLVTAGRFIDALKDRGCRFALDDFGSGLSSFAYLKTLPVDFLKIDGTFVKGIADDSTDYAMVKSINSIAKVMGKSTIAESVETDEVLGMLREIGIDYAQGYRIGLPQPIGV